MYALEVNVRTISDCEIINATIHYVRYISDCEIINATTHTRDTSHSDLNLDRSAGICGISIAFVERNYWSGSQPSFVFFRRIQHESNLFS